MNNLNIGFIGFGNMAQAMAKGLLQCGVLSAQQIYACARNYEKLQKNCERFGIHACEQAQQTVISSDIVILAVKPYQLEQVTAPLKHLLKEKIVISVAAGMPYEKMKEMLEPVTAHLSMIPNTPISTGCGVIVCEKTHTLNEQQLETVKKLFENCAQLVFVDTDLLSIAGTLSGCGPAFAFLFIEALADAGVKYGLTRDVAYQLVSGMLKGSGALQLESGQHPGVLKDAVCSPKGTTIRGIGALEEKGFRSALIHAIDAIEGKR